MNKLGYVKMSVVEKTLLKLNLELDEAINDATELYFELEKMKLNSVPVVTKRKYTKSGKYSKKTIAKVTKKTK